MRKPIDIIGRYFAGWLTDTPKTNVDVGYHVGAGLKPAREAAKLALALAVLLLGMPADGAAARGISWINHLEKDARDSAFVFDLNPAKFL